MQGETPSCTEGGRGYGPQRQGKHPGTTCLQCIHNLHRFRDAPHKHAGSGRWVEAGCRAGGLQSVLDCVAGIWRNSECIWAPFGLAFRIMLRSFSFLLATLAPIGHLIWSWDDFFMIWGSIRWPLGTCFQHDVPVCFGLVFCAGFPMTLGGIWAPFGMPF